MFELVIALKKKFMLYFNKGYLLCSSNSIY